MVHEDEMIFEYRYVNLLCVLTEVALPINRRAAKK